MSQLDFELDAKELRDLEETAANIVALVEEVDDMFAALIRDALLSKKCSFFEHLSYFAGGVFSCGEFFK